MTVQQPAIGDWYRLNGGELFEVVALDDSDATIEIQHFDGTVEEMDLEDWKAQWEEGALKTAAPPEDYTGAVDVDSATADNLFNDVTDESRDLNAGSLDEIDQLE